MKLYVIRYYSQNDENCDFDELWVELINDKGEEILEGDWYHDKIDSKIRGFLKALDYLSIKYTCNEYFVNGCLHMNLE